MIRPISRRLHPIVSKTQSATASALGFSYRMDGTTGCVFGVELASAAQFSKRRLDSFEQLEWSDLSADQLRYAMEELARAVRIFVPRRNLTQRESTEVGPSHCWRDKAKLSRASGAFGCRDCLAYACRCGSCMCDFPGGRDYEGDYLRPRHGLRVERERRVILIRICGKLLSLGAPSPPFKRSIITFG